MSKRATTTAVLGALSAAILLAAAATQLWAFPKPALVAKAWQLDFTCQPPHAIAVLDATGNYKWYWYLPYKVVNNTDIDRNFMPDFLVVTDEGDVVVPLRSVPAEVFEQIKHRLNNRLLEDPAHVIGKLIRGEDNARESIAVWAAPDHPVLHMSVFVAGLSGETQTLADPATGKDVLLNKTLMLEYLTPGKPPILKYQPVVAQGTSWVMR